MEPVRGRCRPDTELACVETIRKRKSSKTVQNLVLVRRGNTFFSCQLQGIDTRRRLSLDSQNYNLIESRRFWPLDQPSNRKAQKTPLHHYVDQGSGRRGEVRSDSGRWAFHPEQSPSSRSF